MYIPNGDTILVVDDDMNTTEVFGEYLNIKGYEVIKAYSAKEGIELYKKRKPTLAIIDLMMPDYDGLYALKKIRKFDPDSKIILTTADLTSETEEKLEKSGVSALIYKPYEIDSVVETIESVMASGCKKFVAEQSSGEKFSLERSCPKCSAKKGFECIKLELDEEFGYEITCNNCGAKFHEIYEFSYWEEINND